MTITYMQNSHLKDRRAVIEIEPKIAARALPVLMDAGFRIVGSASSRGLPNDIVRLVIAGDALPEECAGDGLLLVTMVFEVEAYGEQRITRVKHVQAVKGAEPIVA